MRSSTFSTNEINENILHCCYVCSFAWRLVEDFSFKIGLRRTKKTYKWNTQEHKLYILKMIIPLHLEPRLRMSGAKPLSPQCNFNTGTVKMPCF